MEDTVTAEEATGDMFAAVKQAVRLGQVPAFCIDTRRKLDSSVAVAGVFEPVTIEAPMCGGSHIVWPVDFADGVRWALKIPKHGTVRYWGTTATNNLIAEARTMEMIRRETMFPVPEVLAFEASVNNVIGCPFILMSWVDGMPLSEVWFDESVSPDELRIRRSRTLADLAAAMTQLDQFSSEAGGVPRFDAEGILVGVGADLPMDHSDINCYQREVDPCYFPGPFRNPLSFYTTLLDSSVLLSHEDPHLIGVQQFARLFLQWIPEPEQEVLHEKEPQQRPFVLAHPDFDMPNIIVSPDDGSLQGVIDWADVVFVPRSIGNRAYPGWLTTDWEPDVLMWSKAAPCAPQPRRNPACDSPAVLSQQRSEFRRYLRWFSAGSHYTDPTLVTAYSLIVDKLYFAAIHPYFASLVFEKIFNELRAIKHPPQQIDFMSFMTQISKDPSALGTDWIQYLEAGFKALLDSYQILPDTVLH